MTEFITQLDFSRLYGCSPAYVSKLKRQGRLVLAPNGLVDVEASTARIARMRDPARGGVGNRKQAKAAWWRAQQAVVVISTDTANRFAMETDPRRIRRMLAAEFRDVIEQVAERILSPYAVDARPGPAGEKASVYHTNEESHDESETQNPRTSSTAS